MTMEIFNVPIKAVSPADWNSNEMDESIISRLRRCIERFGLVVPLVVRLTGEGSYETIGGAQRFKVLKETGAKTIPCVLVEADDSEARLLSQALNRISGTDNLGLRAELLRQVLSSMSSDEVLSILPETSESLAAASTTSPESLGDYLKNWESDRCSRLHHLTFQLTSTQIEVVDKTLTSILLLKPRKAKGDNPNNRGTALYQLCKWYLEKERLYEKRH